MGGSCAFRLIGCIGRYGVLTMSVAEPPRQSDQLRTCTTTPAGEAPVGIVGRVEQGGWQLSETARGWPISEQKVRDILRCLERLDATDRRLLRYRRDDLQRDLRLRSQLASVSIASDPSTAAVGRCVRVGTEAGEEHAWWLSLPGDEGATAETVSITSPIGRALAWTAPGDTVYLPGSQRAWAVVLYVTGSR